MHVIQKQIVELEISDETEVFKWHQRVSNLVHDQLTPALNQLFDGSVRAGQVLQVDRLAITIHLRHEQLFEQQFTAEVIKALEAELQLHKTSVLEKPVFTGHERDFKAFLYFLQQGYLPWWAIFKEPEDLEKSIMNALAVLSPETLKAQLKNELIKATTVERLFNQFSVELTNAILALFIPTQITSVIEKIKKVWFEAGTGLPLNTSQLQAAWHQAQVYFTRRIIAENIAPHRLPDQFLLALFTANPGVLTEEFLQEFIRMYQVANPAWYFSPAIKAAFNQSVPGKNKILKQKKDSPDTMENSLKPFVPKADNLNTEEPLGLYVANAGLILLAPFLPAYLQACGLAEADKILKPTEAVHALQYLVTNCIQTPEYELALNKILCGLPLTVGIPLAIELTEVMQTEAPQLLKTIIQYWSALKNTSPAGLQESFLQRSGKLSQKADGDWLLQIEQKGYDMLLEHLPWNYSLVKLPWMENILWVEYS
ncbi:contractile injection system tape measure protein [Adhaeribacter rhizoryzae]|uniref:Uncharacterized protein n=1 Tax=Adhaeribacter rhizoryzae TaxID=2607907 RepID=A0A5M6DLL4_9BACT|nr:contractile injection system tape measure protein [Adhaeribacter rhizoryzae]KAA5548437.1 hypothetical protein F0145_06845 [Adhaeribacter rhizoryzae]